MINEWSLREQVLEISHRWLIPVLAFLLGCLLGWGISYILPAPYRADADLSVAYNADAIYRNPDDYKNWQLDQLNALALSPQVLQETLDRLQAADPTWKQVTLPEFQLMTTVSYRNTGVWHLQVSSPRPGHASLGVQTWQAVILEQYNQASARATELLTLDRQLIPLNDTLVRARWRTAELSSAKSALQAWQAGLTQVGSGQPLDEAQRWKALTLAATAAQLNPAWKELLDQFPAAGAPLQDYQSWVERVLGALDGEIQVVQDQINTVEPQRANLQGQRDQAFQASHGLSAYLSLQKASPANPRATAERSSSLMALTGGLLGFLVWLLAWLGRATWTARK